MPRITKSIRRAIPLKAAVPRRTKISEAYERLGITEDECNAAPKITHILRELPGKVDKAIEYLRGSNDPDARKWLDIYDSLPISVCKILPFEAFCVASGLTTKRMLEIITGACFEQSEAVTALLSKASKPVVLKKSVGYAKQPAGWEDRKMILQHEGYAPIPKTQVINVGGDVLTDNRVQDNRVQSISIGELSNADRLIAKATDRFNATLGIGDGRIDDAKLLESDLEVVPESDVLPVAEVVPDLDDPSVVAAVDIGSAYVHPINPLGTPDDVDSEEDQQPDEPGPDEPGAWEVEL